MAIVVAWGGILVIAQVERSLAPEMRWRAHAFVHLWTAVWATVIARTAIRGRRSRRAVGGAPDRVLTAATVLAATAAVTDLLEMVGAHPALRAFRDAVHRVGAPVGWLLLANLLLVALLCRGRSIAHAEAGGRRTVRRTSPSDPAGWSVQLRRLCGYPLGGRALVEEPAGLLRQRSAAGGGSDDPVVERKLIRARAVGPTGPSRLYP